MWSDDDFRALTPAAQHAYMLIMTSPTLSYCGVADWRPRRIAALARGWTVEAVEAAAAELVAGRYLVIDEDTEECLVRSFVRNDGLMGRERMATAMAKAFALVASSRLRGVVVHELKRLRDDFPDLGGWDSVRAVELLAKEPVVLSVTTSGDLSVEPSTMHPESIDNALSMDLDDLSATRVRAPAPSSMLLAPYSTKKKDSAASPPPSVSAQSVTAAWIDGAKANGVEPSKSQIGQVAKLAKELLDKNDPARVLVAATAAGSKGYVSIDRELTVTAGRNGQVSADGLPAHTKRDPKTGRLVER
ncbi:MAG: 57, gp57 [Amycolatopsis sp.]|nr:57, gp57 [Amycolatopsis sp.]